MAEYFGSATLDGSTKYIRVPNTTKLNFGSSVFFVECWFKTSVGGGVLINKYAASTGWKLEVIAGGELQATVNGTILFSSAKYNDGIWHYVALGANRVSETIFLFCDHSLVDAPLPGGTVSTSADMLIGVDAGAATKFFNGSLAGIRIRSQIILNDPHDSIKPIETLATDLQGDDASTLFLLNFLEGRGGTFYDFSSGTVTVDETPVHANGSLIGDVNGVWAVNGNLLSPPTIIAKEVLLYLFDTFAPLAQFARKWRLRTYRSRFRDTVPVLTVHTTPLLAVFQTDRREGEGEVVGVTTDYATFQEQAVTVLVTGGAYLRLGDLSLVEQLHYLCLKALSIREDQTDGDFGVKQIARIEIGDTQFHMGQQVSAEGNMLAEATPSFAMPVTFYFRRDLRQEGQP